MRETVAQPLAEHATGSPEAVVGRCQKKRRMPSAAALSIDQRESVEADEHLDHR